ncbi:MAG: Gp15 family bacteriophage protein [Candidatus Onthomonas sp.]
MSAGANPLTGPFPTRVRLGGRLYPLRWRVSDCLPVILAYENDRLTPGEQQEILLRRLYPERPADLEGALRLGVAFLNGGEADQDESAPEEEAETPLRLYSFDRDGGLIYSAFRAQYSIDLQREELHWWAFLALFHDLSPDCRFYQLLRLRRGYLEGTLSREEEQLFERMGPEALPPAQPGDREADEHAMEFLRLLEGGDPGGIR